MSYAIYAESLTYVHLVAAETRHECVQLFLDDVESVGARLAHLYNVSTAKNGDIDKKLASIMLHLIQNNKEELYA